MEDVLWTISVRLRRMFYLVTPGEASFKELEEVPRYVDEALPIFFGMIILEIPILFLQGRPLPRFNDAFSSMAAGLFSVLHGLLFRAFELVTYCWMYERYNLVALPWDNPWTWALGFIGVEFGYYWLHRCGHGKFYVGWTPDSSQFRGLQLLYSSPSIIHPSIYWLEVNIIWAAHQTHHSSEDYNLTTALRQSIIQKYFSAVYHMPLAMFVPPSIFFIHIQFNLLYQFWIHTETIRSLGPLEWILNTPSHHRVHHGRNPYCIDKNYGGTLIIFDRLFGTFQAEEEEVIYGLVHPLETWDPFHVQFCHLKYMIKRFQEEKGLKNKLSVIFKGPGWSPGKPWTGLPEDIPEVEKPVHKYNRNVPLWTNLYIWVHFGLLIVGYGVLAKYKEGLSPVWVLGCVLYIVLSLTSFGAIYDHKHYSPLLELFRCGVFVLAYKFYLPTVTSVRSVGHILNYLFIASMSLWIYISVRQNLLLKKMKTL